MTIFREKTGHESILSWKQVLLLLVLGWPFRPMPSVIRGRGMKSKSTEGWTPGWTVCVVLGVLAPDLGSALPPDLDLGDGFMCWAWLQPL